MADKGQLDIEVQINNAIKERAGLLSDQKRMLVDQVAIAHEICRAMDCKELDGFNDRLEQTRKSMLGAADASDKMAGSTQNQTKNLKKSKKSFISWKGVAVGAALAVKNAFGMAFKVIKGIASFAKTVLVGAFRIVRGAMQAWTKMLSGIAQKGMEAGNAGIGLRNAYENVKEELGALDKGAGAAAVGMFNKLKRGADGVAGTGIRFAKMFGRGPDGMAAALDFSREIMGGLGEQLDRFGVAMEDAADEALVLNKGLGFTGEDLGNIALLAGHAGKTVKQAMKDMAAEIVDVSSKFGVNSRVMAKNIGTMMKMPAVFGSNTKEMMKTSVAAQKLGMSIDELTSATKVFDDFESGATAAAELAAEFGVVVNSMDMMSAEPADQMMMLKEAVEASGQSFEDMSRQERMRMAELMGMDPTAMMKMMDPSQAFDQKAMDGVEKGVDATTKATLDQTKATKELAKQMKKLHEAMEPMNTQGGFFGTFIHGMQQGMMRSKEGREIIKSVTEAFKIVYDAGKEVGAMLMELMHPGGPLHFLYEYFTTLPKRMEELMPKVIGRFRDFVDDLNAGGEQAKGALRRLVEGLAADIWGDQSSGFLGSLMAGFHALGDLILSEIIRLVPMVAEGLIFLMKAAIGLMTGDMPEMGKMWGDEGFLPLTKEAFKEVASDPVIAEFGKVFMEMLRTFWDQYGDEITDFLGMVFAAVLTAALLQSLPLILAGGAIKGLMTGISAAFGKQLGPAGAAGAGGAATPSPGMGEKLAEFASGIHLATEELGKIKLTDLAMSALVLAAIGGAFWAALKGILAMALEIQDSGVSTVTFAVTTMAVGGVAASAMAIGKLMEALDGIKIDPASAGIAAAMLIAVGLVFAGVILLVKDTIQDLSTIDPKPGLMKVVQAAGDLAWSITKATASIVGLAAGLGILAVLSGPFAAIIIPCLIAAGYIFYEIANLVKDVVKDFANFTKAQSDKAAKSAKAAGTLTEVLLEVFDRLQIHNKQSGYKKEVFKKLLDSLKDIADKIKNDLMPIMLDAAKLVTGDPAVVKAKLSIVIELVKAFEPLANLMTSVMQVEGMNPDKIADAIDSIAEGIEGVFCSAADLVESILESSRGLNEQEIQSAGAVAGLLGSVGSVLAAIKPEAAIFEDNMVDLGSSSASGILGMGAHNKDFGERVSRTGFEKFGDYLSSFSSILTTIKAPLKLIVEELGKMDLKAITGKDPAKLERDMTNIGLIMEAVAKTASISAIMRNDDDRFTADDARKVKDQFLLINSLFKDDDNGQSVLRSMKPAIDAMSTFVTEVGGEVALNAITATGKMVKSLQTATRTLTVPGIMEIGAKMEAIIVAFSGLNGIWTEAAVQPLLQVVKTMQYLEDELGTPRSVDVNALLRNVGDALGISQEEISVTPGNVEVKVNLVVRMEAEELSKILVQGEYVERGDRFTSDLELDPNFQRSYRR